ncbi:MAG: glycosyltransferase family A protein [Verrucomicrobiia bacterium]
MPNQTFTDFEIVVGDNDSNDGVWAHELVKRFDTTYPPGQLPGA